MIEEDKLWWERRSWWLLLFICTLPCLICVVNQLPFVQQYYANRLDYILGQVEPVLLAGDRAVGDDLSPDGQWLHVDIPTPGQEAKPGMMNMETYQIYPLDVPQGGGPIWIDNHHYKTGRFLIRVPDMATWSLTVYFDLDEAAFAALAEVSHLFAIEEQLAYGYWLVSTDPQTPYLIMAPWSKEEPATNLAGIPYTIIPKRVWALGSGLPEEKFYSPDGRYYLTNASFQIENSWLPLAIFDAVTQKEVALAEKKGWHAILLGWASDSSGVYLEFRPAGAGYGPQPAGLPVYKLLVPGQSPSSKEPTFVEGQPSGG